MIVLEDLRLGYFKPEEIRNLKVQAFLVDKFLEDLNTNPKSITFIKIDIHKGEDSYTKGFNIDVISGEDVFNRIIINSEVYVNIKHREDTFLHEFIHTLQLPTKVFKGNKKKIRLVYEVTCVAVVLKVIYKHLYEKELEPNDVYKNFEKVDEYLSIKEFVETYFEELNGLTEVGDVKKFLFWMWDLQVRLAEYLNINYNKEKIYELKNKFNELYYDIRMIKYFDDIKEIIRFSYAMYKSKEKYLDMLKSMYLTVKEEKILKDTLF